MLYFLSILLVKILNIEQTNKYQKWKLILALLGYHEEICRLAEVNTAKYKGLYSWDVMTKPLTWCTTFKNHENKKIKIFYSCSSGYCSTNAYVRGNLILPNGLQNKNKSKWKWVWNCRAYESCSNPYPGFQMLNGSQKWRRWVQGFYGNFTHILRVVLFIFLFLP